MNLVHGLLSFAICFFYQSSSTYITVPADHNATSTSKDPQPPQSASTKIANQAMDLTIFKHNATTYLINYNLTNDTTSRIRRVTPIMLATPPSEEEVCGSSSEDFPELMTLEQQRNGGVIIAFLVGIYCFTLLALVCDSYFLPCVERICEVLNLPQNVAAATFMATATSAPELFVNVVGTFVTESDIGIGTVSGSNLFNTLGVAALGGLAASSPIKIDWWPLTRDVIVYIFTILLMVLVTWDGVISWFDSLILVVAAVAYYTIIFNSERFSSTMRKLAKKLKAEKNHEEKGKERGDVKKEHLSTKVFYIEDTLAKYVEAKPDEPEREADSKLWTVPEGGAAKKIFFFYSWPIRLFLFCTIPDPRTHPRLFPLTFIMCVICIGLNSYVVSWMIAVIGSTFRVSDAVMGMTFLAAGGCLPEAISMTIMSRQGNGHMGVSNSMGANTIDILLSLGLPWFLKTSIMGPSKGVIRIASGTIEYTILGLILVAITLYIVLYWNKFRLSKRSGIILMTCYVVYLTMGICSELFLVGSQPCSEKPGSLR